MNLLTRSVGDYLIKRLTTYILTITEVGDPTVYKSISISNQLRPDEEKAYRSFLLNSKIFYNNVMTRIFQEIYVDLWEINKLLGENDKLLKEDDYNYGDCIEVWINYQLDQTKSLTQYLETRYLTMNHLFGTKPIWNEIINKLRKKQKYSLQKMLDSVIDEKLGIRMGADFYKYSDHSLDPYSEFPDYGLDQSPERVEKLFNHLQLEGLKNFVETESDNIKITKIPFGNNFNTHHETDNIEFSFN